MPGERGDHVISRGKGSPMSMLSRRRAGCRLLAAAALSALVQVPVAADARPQQKVQAKAAAGSAVDSAAKRNSNDPAPVASSRRSGPLFAVVIGPGPSWKKGQPLKKGSDGHWKYWQDLHARGLVESAGPVGRDTGFVLLRARNQREANALLAADPAVRTGRFRGVARPYDQTIGD